MKKYSETVAFQIQTIEFQKNQYKAIKLVDSGDIGIGDLFVVYGEGDTGCNGGNGTVVPNFTVVEQNGFPSVSPVVVTGYKFPELDMVQLTSITGSKGTLNIKGVTYGPSDQQGSPKKVVNYVVKFVDGKFTKQ